MRLTDGSLTAVEQRESSGLSLAMANVVLRLFEGKFTNIRILSSIMDHKRTASYEVVSDFIIELDSRMKVTIEEAKGIKNSPSKRGSPMIILIHSIESFGKIKEKFAFDNLRFRKFYLIVAVDGVFAEFATVIGTLWEQWIFNFYVLDLNSDGSVSLQTFYPFGNDSCGQSLEMKLINRFNASTRIWRTQTFTAERFTNLNSCPIKVAVLKTSLPSVIREKAIGEHSGFEIDIFKEIAREFNSTPAFEDFEAIGTIYDNKSTSLGSLPSVYKRAHDAALGTLSLQYERANVLTETKSFLSAPLILVVPLAERISPLQKLTRPLSAYVWTLTIITFFVGFTVILCLKATSEKAYDFVVGRGVNYPYLNMMIGFFGTTQHKLPKTTFARFLLTKFLIFCLIIRCLYQGKLYIMLQLDLHEKQVDTIDEIMNRNMVFYTYESLSKRIEGFKFANR